MESHEDEIKIYTVVSSNPYVFATFSNLNELFRLGAQRPLEQSDLGLREKAERTSTVFEIFSRVYKQSHPNRSLWWIIWDTVGWYRPLLGLFLQCISCGCAFGPPLILNALVAYFSGPLIYPNGQLDKVTLWILVCLLFVLPITAVICAGHAARHFTDLSSLVRSTLVPAIFHKSLILGNASKQTFSSGMIVNLFGNDITHIQIFLQQFAEPFFALPQLIVALALIYLQVGVSMFVGMALVIAVLPIMIILVGIYISFRNKKAAQGDIRVKLTNEVLSGIRILKYYAWEKAYAQKIDVLREVEVKWLAGMNYVMPIFITLMVGVPVAMPIAIFFTYVSLGNQLDPARAFTTLALFGLIAGPMMQIPRVIQMYLTANLSMRRISNFLRADEIVPYVQRSGDLLPEGVSVCLRNASLSWTSPDVLKVEEEEEKQKEKAIQLVSEKEGKRKGVQSYSAVSQNTSETEKERGQQPTKGDIEMSKLSPSSSNPSPASPTKSLFSSTKATTLNRSLHTLTNITLCIKTGSLVAIVGGVGSGKSSLLYTLLGDLYLQSEDYPSSASPPEMSPSSLATLSLIPKGPPAVTLKGTIAYHAQVPWILNASVRDNILFGQPYDADRFEAAIAASCLGPDIAILPKGLDTEIGERGINLSGGQKARVSFCRTVYRNADIVLLDDPLSAVDAHVAEHLFHKGICETILKQGKTVILVTHQIHLLEKCDQIVCLEEGAVKVMGNLKEIRELGFDLEFLEQQQNQNVKVEGVDDEKGENNKKKLNKEGSSSPRERSFSHPGSSSSSSEINEPLKNVSSSSSSSSTSSPPPQSPTEMNEGKLMTDEERIKGEVNLSIYFWYLREGGIFWFLVSILFFIGATGCSSYSNFYLSDWSKDTIKHSIKADVCQKYGIYCPAQPLSKNENIYFLNIYALISMMSIVGNSLRSVCMGKVGVNASRKMHRNLVTRVLGASVAFFDTTPMGRILNRFSADVTQADERLSFSISMVLGFVFNLLGLIGSVAYSTQGYFLIVIPPLLYLYYHAMRFFSCTNTELKRLENISRSPIYSEFQEVLQGVTSLRAFNEQDSFIHKMERRVDENTVVVNLQMYCLWWLNIRLDLISGICSFFIAALAVGDRNLIPLQYLALSLQQAFSLTSTSKMVVTQLALLEAMMSSVERIKYYTENIDVEEPMLLADPPSEELPSTPKKVVSESPSPSPSPPYSSIPTDTICFASEELVARRLVASSPPPDWPSEGKIEFRGVDLRYRDGPLVLHGLTVSIKGREKVGIAGRTGSGKSSLMVALFRIAPLAEGSVLIDGIDISTLPLHILRSRLGIIPQDPVMFSATIRYNLDPLGGHSDEELWKVLEMVNMKSTVESMPKKMDEEVAEGGESLSLGQRQLINIARVILRKPKILVMDEATASIDMDTDAFVQEMVRVQFQDCTVLTIAHRLQTIINSDRIMVLDKGYLKELDKPSVLLETPGGMFAGLWAQHLSSRQEAREG